ncbi:MAG: DUF3572 domain-containing protein [Sphingomonadales bacterium]|nr:DUF3572 domain-containing protein [Sphingomonadales bacterium]
MRQSKPSAQAETIALNLLEYIASDGDRLAAFLGTTGFAAGDLRAAAGNPEFLAGVMDYAFGNEPLLVDYASSFRITPEELARAHHQLCGGTM